MTRREFVTWFNEQVQPRWPRWEVNRCLLSDWYDALGRYDAATLTKAVRRHRIRDDLARPKISRILSIAGELSRAAAPPSPPCEPPPDVVTAEQFWEIVRTTFPRHKRLHLMRALVKFHRDPRSKDPQAYDWLMQERASADAAAPTGEPDAPESIRPAVSAFWHGGCERGA
jgi:hypothetical protein